MYPGGRLRIARTDKDPIYHIEAVDEKGTFTVYLGRDQKLAARIYAAIKRDRCAILKKGR